MHSSRCGWYGLTVKGTWPCRGPRTPFQTTKQLISNSTLNGTESNLSLVHSLFELHDRQILKLARLKAHPNVVIQRAILDPLEWLYGFILPRFGDWHNRSPSVDRPSCPTGIVESLRSYDIRTLASCHPHTRSNSDHFLFSP